MSVVMTIQQQVDALTQCLWNLIYQYPEESYKSRFEMNTPGRVIDGWLERELDGDGRINGIRVVAHGYLTANFIVCIALPDIRNWTLFQELAFKIRRDIAIKTISVTDTFPYL